MGQTSELRTLEIATNWSLEELAGTFPLYVRYEIAVSVAVLLVLYRLSAGALFGFHAVSWTLNVRMVQTVHMNQIVWYSNKKLR